MSLGFLNNFFLYFLPLVFVPVILHLLFKKKPIRVLFGYLEFIKISNRRVMPRSKLTQWILILIRSLIILCTVFLFSRPLMHVGAGSEAGEENALALVLVMDTSYSMRAEVNGRSLFERARQTAELIIGQMKPADRAAVLLFSDILENPSPALVADTKNLLTVVKKSSPGFRITDCSAGIAAAFELLSQSSAVNKGIIVLTDAAAHGWKINNRVMVPSETYDPAVHMLMIDCSMPAENVFLEGMNVTRSATGDHTLVEWRIYNPDRTTYTDKEISVILEDGGTVSRGLVLDAGKTTRGFIPFPAEFEGVIPARIIVGSDAIREDNTWYFFASASAPIPILCVDGDPEMGTVRGETYFLKQALHQETHRDSYTVSVVNEKQFQDMEWSDYRVLMLCNVGSLPQNVTEKFSRFLDNGGGIGIFPGDNVRAEAYDAIDSLMPVSFSRTGTKQSRSPVRKGNGYETLFTLSKNEPFFEVDKISVESFFLLEEKSFASVPFRLSGGSPFLALSRASDRKVAVMSVPIDRDWSNLPAKPIYVPLINALIQYLGSVDRYTVSYSFDVGEKIYLTMPDQSCRVSAIVSLEGTKHLFSQTGRQVVVQPVEKPGHVTAFYVDQHKKKKMHFSVNVNTRENEGNLEKVDNKVLQELFPRSSVSFLKNSPTVVREIMMTIRGREITRSIIGFLIILLAAELLVAAYIQRSHKR